VVVSIASVVVVSIASGVVVDSSEDDVVAVVATVVAVSIDLREVGVVATSELHATRTSDTKINREVIFL
jgi:hypothetical protein